MLKSERGMSKVELVVGIIVIIIIASFAIFLATGEDGLSFLIEDTNMVNEPEEGNEIQNGAENVVEEQEEENEDEQEQQIDDTVYSG